jgi:hypothetical protein
MESFFRRVSSIVRKNNNKSYDTDDNEQENHDEEEENNGRRRQFRQMRGRRRSAPDIRRRAPTADKLSMESNQKGTSSEQIDSQRLSAQSSTTALTRKQYSSSGKLSSFNSLILLRIEVKYIAYFQTQSEIRIDTIETFECIIRVLFISNELILF